MEKEFLRDIRIEELTEKYPVLWSVKCMGSGIPWQTAPNKPLIRQRNPPFYMQSILKPVDPPYQVLCAFAHVPIVKEMHEMIMFVSM